MNSSPSPCRKKDYLLPRILAHGREWLRRCSVRLCISLEDDCIEGPYSLLSIAAQPEGAAWEPVPQPSAKQMLLHVHIPLICQIRDRCGHIHTGYSEINTEVCMFLSCSPDTCHQHSTMLLPSVRLACMPCASSDLCFDTQLEILIEAYMVRWEPLLQDSPCFAGCKELPLYPELHHSC